MDVIPDCQWVICLTIEVLKADSEESSAETIKRAAEILITGGLVVYPTDTSYGIACDPRDSDALDRLLSVKRREKQLGVPLLFSDMTQCEQYHDFGSLERVIARLFWPGSLTLIVKPKDGVPDHITVGRGSVAIRVPNHFVPRALARQIGGPIVGTSANRTGGPSPFQVAESVEQLGDEVDLYIDGGPSSSTKNSTIVGVEEDGNIKVYREGQISIDSLTEYLKVDSDAMKLWTMRIVYPEM
jgi:L-threonylcarbamoyladenylate synthase